MSTRSLVYFGQERIGVFISVITDVIFAIRRKKGDMVTVVFLGKKSTERRFVRKVSV